MATRYDIHFQPLPRAEQTSTSVFTFGFLSAVGVRGPQKLINRWLKVLLTPQGSDPFDKAYGTGFTNLIGSNIQSVTDVLDTAALAVQECNTQVRAAERNVFTPPEERLQTATILKIEEVGRDGFDIWVAITNAAGLTVTVLLPQISTRS
jgi:hypothetical protein